MAKKKAKRSSRKTAKKGSKKAPSRRKKSTKSTPAREPEKWPDWADEFLEVLSEKGDVSQAAAAVGLERSRPYKVRYGNPRFEKLWKAAHRQGKLCRYEELAEKSLDRAINGYDEPVFHKGLVCGYKTRFPQSTEQFHLRMGLPKQFNLANGDITGGVGGVTPEQQAAMVRLFLAAMNQSVPK